MLYVFALAAAFACFWFVLASLQTFEPAGPARPLNIVLAIVFAALAAGIFWLARRVEREGNNLGGTASATGRTEEPR